VHFVFSHLRLGLPRGVILSSSPTKTLHRVLAYSMCDIRPTCLQLLFSSPGIRLTETKTIPYEFPHYPVFFIFLLLLLCK
jgi:hypothetical protein